MSDDGVAIDTVFPNTGCCDAVFSAASTDAHPGILSQTLVTMPSQSYSLDFAVLDEAGFSGDSFKVSFGGFTATITGDKAAPPGDLPSFYTAVSFTVPGADVTGANTLLSFEGLSDPFSGIAWNLDDVSVAPAAPAPVPEPASLLLLAAALAAGASPLLFPCKREKFPSQSQSSLVTN